jgi:predicted DNA-binding WGR domain protein
MVMLFREGDRSISKFDFYEVTITDTVVANSWGQAGGKLKSKEKNYADPDKAEKAFARAIKKQIGNGYFECEGGHEGPSLQAPLSLSIPPLCFEKRLEILGKAGIFIHAAHHFSFHDDHCNPIEILTKDNCNHPEAPILDFIEDIKKSTEIKEHLVWYRDFDIQYSTEDEWNEYFRSSTEGSYCSWFRLESAEPTLGAYQLNGKAEAVDLCVKTEMLTEEVSGFSMSHLELEKSRNGFSVTEDQLKDLMEDWGELTDLGRMCLKNSARLIAETRAWLFNGYDVFSYDVTTSTTYMVIQRPLSLRVYILRNTTTDELCAYFYHMQFEN